MINGGPYSPHSQGVVERIHLTIRYALLSKFLENKKEFNLANDLPLIMNSYNNTVHRITKHKPNEIFYTQAMII